jgi:hypothetical protein
MIMTHTLEEHIYVNWVVTGQVEWGRVGRGEVGTHSEQMSPAFQLVYTPRSTPSPCPYLFVFKGAGLPC